MPSINWWSTRAPATVDALGRFIEHQQAGPVDHGAGDQQALQLAARQRGDRRVAEAFKAHGGKRGVDVAGREAAGQFHQPAQAQRQRMAHRQPLRHVADLQPRVRRDSDIASTRSAASPVYLRAMRVPPSPVSTGPSSPVP